MARHFVHRAAAVRVAGTPPGFAHIAHDGAAEHLAAEAQRFADQPFVHESLGLGEHVVPAVHVADLVDKPRRVEPGGEARAVGGVQHERLFDEGVQLGFEHRVEDVRIEGGRSADQHAVQLLAFQQALVILVGADLRVLAQHRGDELGRVGDTRDGSMVMRVGDGIMGNPHAPGANDAKPERRGHGNVRPWFQKAVRPRLGNARLLVPWGFKSNRVGWGEGRSEATTTGRGYARFQALARTIRRSARCPHAA